MKMLKWLMVVVTALIVCACGGGGGGAGTTPFGSGSGSGGGSSGGTTATPSLTLTLTDSSGMALASPTLNGTQNAIAVVKVLDASGLPVKNAFVTVSSTGLTLTPTSGQQITDDNGTAKVQIRPTDPFASGATTITAASSVGTTTVSQSVNVGLGAATASLGTLTASASTVPAYQTIQVTVPATLNGSTPAVQYPVTFSASCGTFDPVTASTDSSGVARTSFRNQTGTTGCSGTQTLTATAGSSTANTTVVTQAPIAANIVFISATPNRIYLNGSPGVSASQLAFKLVDSSNNPVSGANVTLTMTLKPTGAYLGSAVGTTAITTQSGADGTFSTDVHAGAQPGPVQVKAVLDSNTAITNVSNSLAIASGLPVQQAFSLSVSTFNMEALDTDGVASTITLRIADRLGNPVPDGTTVNFVTEGGQIVGSCNTSGAAAGSASSCSVVLTSQLPRPTNGRFTVLAWAQGEEYFSDAGTPSNNIYDAGESFEDIGQPFLDKNENGLYDAGADVTVGSASGAAACPLIAGVYSVPNTCNGAWGQALVRAQAVLVFSGSEAFLSNVQPMDSLGSNRCEMEFTLHDGVKDLSTGAIVPGGNTCPGSAINGCAIGNPLPAGATLAISSVTGGGAGGSAGADAKFEGFGGGGDKVPNRSTLGGTTHSAIFSNCASPAAVQFKLTVTTPRLTKSLFLP